MKWFYDLKISVKLLTGFIIVAMIAGGIGIMGVVNMNKINTLDTKLYTNMTAPFGELVKVIDSYHGMRKEIRDAILATNTTEYSESENIFREKSNHFDKDLNEFSKTILTEEGKKLVTQLQNAKSSYVDNANKIFVLAKESKDVEALNVLHGDGAKIANDVDNAVQGLTDAKLKLAKEASESNDATTKNSTTVFVVLMMSGVAIAIGFGVFLSKIIGKPIKRLTEVADKLAIGDVDVDVKANTKDEIGKLMDAFTKMITNVREQEEASDKIASGDLDIDIKVKSDKDIFSKSLIKVVNNLKNLLDEMNHMSKEHDNGEIDVFVAEDKFQGAYKVMATGVNGMVKGHISVKKKAMACISEFVKGNFDAELEKFPGKKAFINDNIEALRNNLKEVNSEINKLIVASNEGKLSQRADVRVFQGDWAQLMKGLNGIIDGIMEPIKEASNVLDEMSKGNLQLRVKGDYQGDHAKIKNALNDTINNLYSYVDEISRILTEMANGNLVVGIDKEYKGDFAQIKNSLNNIIKSFNEILNDIKNTSSQVAVGSRQVSESSQILSQGSTEQATAIEELTAAIEEIAAQTKQNAENASQANELATCATEDAVKGNDQMKEMLKAMSDINESSSNISKIIKVIDEIAFQTNILALNAAVEAARAGQHGKGFAVVAEEVRNLAARSANAAKETTDLIEGSIKRVESGTKIANDTAEALNEIVEGVAKASNLVGEIAVYSTEQATGIEQINQAIMQVSEVIQSNNSTSDESAAASEELSSQAEVLRQMVGKFKLKNNGYSDYGMNQLNQNMSSKNKSYYVEDDNRNTSISDKNFGKY